MPFPFHDPFDEDAFEDEPSAAGDFDHPDAGAPSPADPGAEARRRALARALAHGETGVPLTPLLQLSLPLMALYGLDADDVLALTDQPDTAPPDAVALLEAARLLWAFLSLPESEQAAAIGPLLEHLGGAEPDADGWEVVHELIETTQPAWDALGGREGAAARAPDALAFDALLAHPAFSDHAALPGHSAGDAPAAGGYGANGLSEVEARALFAQPLLDDPAVLADPDAFEAALERADAYWEIALLSARERALAAFVRREGGSAAERERIQAEGQLMLDRFDGLFSA